MDSYIVERIASAKKSIYHLSWKDFNPNSSRPNHMAYMCFQQDLLQTIESKLVEGIFYKDIFTFYKRKERINKMNNLMQYDSYWCGFYESNGQIPRFPKLNFLIIDSAEVIFASYEYKDNYCSVFDDKIVNIMLAYFEECWSLCKKIKDYDGFHQPEYESAISDSR
ncbi:MAG: hypothetical protein NC331_05040 [Lachnospiraceae bacterium]|nr:hypothetical protein [Lachnospiraceae bacterium]